ncbi:MAG: type secretion protein [Spartobacteria bacterium]|nr:type secretion protein [Spartobacteria bacterium]
MFWKMFVPVALTAFVLGFPAAEIAVHGFNISMWPATARTPEGWFVAMGRSFGVSALLIYRDMIFGQTQSLGAAGLPTFGAIIFGPLLALAACFMPHYGPRRDPSATYGDARWTTRRERKRMRIGLELGLDPDTGRPVRVTTESHLITVAPPRTGKTSGLLIPNLLVPDRTSWFGPSVVFDPKGEAYRAVATRRRELGRTVRCLDPIGIVGGKDTWNPLATIAPHDILYLQRVARSLLPDFVGGETVYFQNRAIAAMVGAFLAAHHMKSPTPHNVSLLLSDVDKFQQALSPLQGAAAEAAKAILKMEPRGRDDILSTAAQGFSWCADERLQHLTNKSTFALSDLTGGDTDLFITLPTEDLKTLTPLLRWLLCDLFTAVRRQRPQEPIVCFIDEAATLGRFDELITAAGELPGYNMRLWTFWQDRSQIIRTYGNDGAKTLLNTADIVSYSDLALIEPDEREFLSRAIGDYTLLEKAETHDEAKVKKVSASYKPTAVRLMTADAVGQVAADSLIILPNSAHYPKRPMLLRKTRFDDPRFNPLRSN